MDKKEKLIEKLKTVIVPEKLESENNWEKRIEKIANKILALNEPKETKLTTNKEKIIEKIEIWAALFDIKEKDSGVTVNGMWGKILQALNEPEEQQIEEIDIQPYEYGEKKLAEKSKEHTRTINKLNKKLN